jgi:hypothetical protein
MPAYPHSICSFHSTPKPLQASIYIHQSIKHQASPLDSHNLLHHPTINQQPTLSHNACHVRIPSLPWSSPKQASSSSSQVNHQPLRMILSNHITSPTFHDNIQPARQTCTPVCSSISCPLPALHLYRLDCILEAGTFEHLFSLDSHLFNSKHDPQHAWLHPHCLCKSAARQCTCLCLPSSAFTLAH